MERLDKFLCDCQIGTRSQVKSILKAGRIRIDGRTQTDGSCKIDPQIQTVCLDGEPVARRGRIVLMLHKPAGFVTATQDASDKTVMELLPEKYAKADLKPVGRLDKETEGLLLFTNDGELLHRLISPKMQIDKIYFARHEGNATQEDIRAFAKGLTLRDGTLCLSAKLTPLAPGQSLICVQEGKYHQVRRMMASRNMTVTYLKRLQEGDVALAELPLGKVRELTDDELTNILKSVNLL